MRTLFTWALAGATLVAAGAANATNCTDANYRKLQFESSDTGGGLWQSQRVDSPLDPNSSRIMLHVLLQDYAGIPQPYDYVAVFSNCTGIEGKPLSQVRNLSFDYLNDSSQPVHTGAGAPRISVEIDTDGDNFADVYAYLAAYYCPEPIASNPTWSRADFTGRVSPGCSIWTSVQFSSDGTNSAWSNLAAAYPTGKVVQAYLILDESGTAFVDRLAIFNKMYVQAGTGSAAIKNCPAESSC